jgi:hypothetical protein
VDDALTVNDPDSTNLTGATVTISANFQSGDTLHFTNQLGISFVSYGGGVLTLSGTTTLANYQTALHTVTFDNTTNDNPTNFGAATIRTITWVGNDGAGANNLSTGVTTTINVTGIDDPALPRTMPSWPLRRLRSVPGSTCSTTTAWERIAMSTTRHSSSPRSRAA